MSSLYTAVLYLRKKISSLSILHLGYAQRKGKDEHDQGNQRRKLHVNAWILYFYYHYYYVYYYYNKQDLLKASLCGEMTIVF